MVFQGVVFVTGDVAKMKLKIPKITKEEFYWRTLFSL